MYWLTIGAGTAFPGLETFGPVEQQLGHCLVRGAVVLFHSPWKSWRRMLMVAMF
jgi:hypothetical protein